MARLNSLLNVRQMLKAELGFSLNTNVSVIDNNTLNYLLMNTQNWLASEYDWDFLRSIIDVNVGGGAQYLALPTTIVNAVTVQALNMERATQLKVQVFYNQFYFDLVYGIDEREYNVSNPAIGQYQTPAERWCFSDEADIELWPVGQQAQVIRFIGQRITTTLFSAGITFNDAALFDLDDLLVVYFAGAKLLQREKDPSAQDMLARATKRLADIKASYPTRESTTIIRGETDEDASFTKRVRAVPIVTVAPLGH